MEEGAAAEGLGVSHRRFLEEIPFEVRLRVYSTLDRKSLLIMRLVNSSIKEEIDSNIGLDLTIDSIEIGPEMVQELCNKRINSVTFGIPAENKYEAEISRFVWRSFRHFVFKYPLDIKTLEFRQIKLMDQDGRTCVDVQRLLQYLMTCKNLEYLIINKVKFYGEYLEAHQRDQLEIAVGELKRLKTLQIEFASTFDREIVSLPFLSIIINHCQSLALNKIDLSLKISRYLHHINPEIEIIHSPWTSTLKLAARHWKTLKVLALNIPLSRNEKVCYGFHKHWKLSLDEQAEFKRLIYLREIRLNNCEDEPLGVHEHYVGMMILNLLQQQEYLEKLHLNNFCTNFETVSSSPRPIIQLSPMALKSLTEVRITNFSNKWNPNKDTLDMELFSSMDQLETLSLELERGHGTFTIVNLGKIPEGLKKLRLIGFCLPDGWNQLLECSENCMNLRSVRLEFGWLERLGGLFGVITKFIENCPMLESIWVAMKPPPAIFKKVPENIEADLRDRQRREEWDVEYPRLVKLFKSFTFHYVLESLSINYPSQLSVNMISSEDRINFILGQK